MRRVTDDLRVSAKRAVRIGIDTISRVQVSDLWTDAPSIHSKSTLYAQADPAKRSHIPSAQHLSDMADVMVAQAQRLLSAADRVRTASIMLLQGTEAGEDVDVLPTSAVDLDTQSSVA